MNIINLDQLISMTSKEIAELTGKRHDNVIRDVRKMLDEIYPDGGSSVLRTPTLIPRMAKHIACTDSTGSIPLFWSLGIASNSALNATTTFRCLNKKSSDWKTSRNAQPYSRLTAVV